MNFGLKWPGLETLGGTSNGFRVEIAGVETLKGRVEWVLGLNGVG